jgi:Domain of unknown function (DUF4160)
MPTISIFYGMVIQMYWQDHNPPHFHVRYGANQAVIEIQTGIVIRGQLPSRAFALLQEWIALHQAELLEDWNLCQIKQTPKPIAPLK